MHRNTFLCLTMSFVLPIISSRLTVAAESNISDEQREFFEREIRPILANQCYGCHNSTDTAEGGFILDHRSALMKGGQSGPPLNLNTPEDSLLLKVLRHEIEELEMPQGDDQLSAQSIKKFEEWIAMGAPDPRVKPPEGTDDAAAIGWEATLAERKKWWSFQPLQTLEIPTVEETAWPAGPIDQFVLSRMEQEHFSPSKIADRESLIRRLSFVVRGLPPSPEEVEAFKTDADPAAYSQLVDRFLTSPAFGEHWARHFMDLVRYAESHGSEGDPTIPNAWKYRDYLIRALNSDVPYDQILIEHVAGDLLKEPRINPVLGINESAIATAHWRMCFHGFAPTDALDEKVRFTDDQINVFSKAFLGLTVSCARCHNHKFDPISQADYYALFGVIGSPRPGIIDINPKTIQSEHIAELSSLKNAIREEVGNIWKSQIDNIDNVILESIDSTPIEALTEKNHFLFPFSILEKERKLVTSSLISDEQSDDCPAEARCWDFRNQQDVSEWFVHGNGTATQTVPSGEFVIPHEGDLIGPILQSGVYSHLLSTKHRNIFSSPDFNLEGKKELWLKVKGDANAMTRYVVHDYPRNGTVYPVKTLTDGEWKWQRYDLSYWEGERVHIEITTAADSAVLAKGNERSWFGVQRAIVAPLGSFRPVQDTSKYSGIIRHSLAKQLTNRGDLVAAYSASIASAVSSWSDGKATDQQVTILNESRKLKLLTSPDSPTLRELVEKYRKLEAAVAVPNRIVGPLEADASDHALYIRGNHRQAGAQIERRFLEAFDSTPYNPEDSGRRQLAESLINEASALTSRVIVNRLWHYIFGSGLVRTADNFGRLGEEPSHPELLDYLALELQNKEWSLKLMIREMLLSKTFQLSAESTFEAQRTDPDNRLLTHANVRRLTGEELRDALLVASNRIDRAMYGPPIGNSTEHPRRSVYLSVRRNSLNPFLETFDAPVPFAPKGRRDTTNVPAQSLTMLNDAFVRSSAEAIIRQIPPGLPADGKIRQLFQRSLGRSATENEQFAANEFVKQLMQLYDLDEQSRTYLQNRIAGLNKQYSQIYEGVRQQLVELKQDRQSKVASIAPPIAEWKFDDSPNDSFNRLNGQLHGDAMIAKGALQLKGNGYFASPPLHQDLKEKTLEVVVQLDNLSQRGGGLLTVQDLSGVTFDSVVYGEMQPQQWLAGSNNFARTQSFGGTTEEITSAPIHIAITYGHDGTIHCYRNGVNYGKAYRSNGPVHFHAKKTQVLIGLRHGSPTGNRLFRGNILSARLYDRELNAQEVAVAAGNENSIIADAVIREAMTAEQRQFVDSLQLDIDKLNKKLKALGESPKEHQAWIDLAHSIFNLKEFIYIQ